MNVSERWLYRSLFYRVQRMPKWKRLLLRVAMPALLWWAWRHRAPEAGPYRVIGTDSDLAK